MGPQAAITLYDKVASIAPSIGRPHVDLIKNTVAVGTTDDELLMFLHQAQKTGLDPLSRQIHCVKRKQKRTVNGQDTWIEVATIQTGIDGYRLVAERTGNYAPGKPIEFTEDPKTGKLFKARAFVQKKVDGQWFEIAADAYWDEYVQTNYKGEATAMWAKMPHTMLGKCAEALALRKAFPMELSGVYTKEEMDQSDSEPINVTPVYEQTNAAQGAAQVYQNAAPAAAAPPAAPPSSGRGRGKAKTEPAPATKEAAATVDVSDPTQDELAGLDAASDEPKPFTLVDLQEYLIGLGFRADDANLLIALRNRGKKIIDLDQDDLLQTFHAFSAKTPEELAAVLAQVKAKIAERKAQNG